MYPTTGSTSRAKHRFAPAPLALLIRQCLGAGLVLAAAGVAAQTAGTTHTGAAAPSGTALKEVVVSDQAEAIGGLQKTYAGGQFARGGSLGILGNTDLMNVPFSTTNYTSELIQNQQALSVADVVMNDASVRTLTSRGGFGDDFQVRGFTVSNTDISMNGLFGLAPSTRVPLEMIERVEVLKGPGALATGVGPGASIGGSINVVTKRAADAPLTRLTTTYMGKSQFGAHLDVGRRFGEDNQWGVRVNGLVRGGEGNIDGGKQNLNLGSLGLDYVGARTRWSLDALVTRGHTNEFRPQTSFSGSALAVPAVPDARLNFYPGTKLQDNVKTVMSRIEHDLSDSITVYGSAGYTDLDYEQTFPSGRPDALGNFNVSNAYYDQYTQSKAADVGVRTKFKTGSVNHTLAVGANYLDQETGYFYATSTTTNPSNLYNPAPLPAMTVARSTPGRSLVTEQSSLAVADTMGFANDSVLVTLGLRHQTMKQTNYNVTSGAQTSQYNESAVTPLAGLVFKPMKNVSVYTNYTAGLSRGATAGPTTANAGETFAPQKSKQNEVGVKVDWGRLTTQAAVYQIKRPGAMTDPVINVYSFGGEQRNRGLELTAYGEIERGLRAMASASFKSAKLTRTAGGVNQGNDAAGVPDRTFNLGLDWDTPVQGLSINGRVINTSAVYADAANRLRVDAWTRLDLGARYATKVAGKPVVFRANLENVTDKNYWVVSNYVTVGAPRTLMLSAAVDF
ncbi:MAG: TonB-dependent siderophore receptor [Gammaproteobacteria bacterium]|nr:TonB-dependent siderophore receptor [Gammaproteobacteria bacterium]MBU1507995.1 TonB-dependent siderophore receptor [Gammaproteobacteria bacterium]MBU2121468.1 TonB-dependent siderophore receptor [Gammaproteobacteria bacterium]MBU2173175.1 TonB-dependent siderophore receptor [Gammaproteobacteria bacterium]MBU2199373.1 TonB-dependent siderophore receptor [Gammaproteobacteria bacterium]